MFGICTAVLAALALARTSAHTIVIPGDGVRATGQAVLLRSDAEEGAVAHDPYLQLAAAEKEALTASLRDRDEAMSMSAEADCSVCPDGVTPTGTNGTLAVVGNNGEPADAFPLGLCQGDCDDDDQCQEGLRCFIREPGGPNPPGCAGSPINTGGTADNGNDFCYDPAAAKPCCPAANTTDIHKKRAATAAPAAAVAADTAAPTKAPVASPVTAAPTTAPVPGVTAAPTKAKAVTTSAPTKSKSTRSEPSSASLSTSMAATLVLYGAASYLAW